MWVALSLVCALSLATADALTKKATEGVGEYVVGWLRLLFTAPILAVLLLFVETPPLDRTFYLTVAAALPLEILAFMLYIKALRVSPLSLTIPFLAFTPVFLVGSSYAIAGEAVSAQGAVGIMLIAGGGYLLHFEGKGRGMLGPFRAMTREKGSLLMLVVAAIYSITSSLGKVAINHSAPLFFGAVYFIVLAACYAPFALPEIRKTKIPTGALRTMVFVGALNAVMVSTHMLAMSMTKVAYMISVKRTSLLFSVLYGYLLFREGRPAERFLAAAVMFAGFVLVVTSA